MWCAQWCVYGIGLGCAGFVTVAYMILEAARLRNRMRLFYPT